MNEPTAKEAAAAASVEAPRASLGKIFELFLITGAISFGGGIVAYLHEYLVRRERWLNEEQFLDALEVGETLPGLNSVNLAVIVGDRMRGVIGAAVAVVGLILPGSLVVMGLALAWEQHHHNPHVREFLTGITAAAVGLLLTVTLQLGRGHLSDILDLAVIAATFVSISLLRQPLWLVMPSIVIVAIVLNRIRASGSKRERIAHLRARLASFRAHLRH